MKAIFRNFIFVFKRFKSASVLNIVGLSVAIAVFIITLMQVRYDFTFDKSYKNVDNIYLYNMYVAENDRDFPWLNTERPESMAGQHPEIESYCIFKTSPSTPIQFIGDDNNLIEIEADLAITRSGFIEIFSPKVIEGDPVDALSSKGKVILTKSIAEKIFGKQSAIGKTIFFNKGKDPQVVSAVVEDFPDNSTIKNNMFTYGSEDRPENANCFGFFTVSPDNIDKLRKYLNSEENLGKEYLEQIKNDPSKIIEHQLINIADIHFHYPLLGNGSLSTTLSLLAMGIVTLIMAYINFINFSIAMTPSRMRTFNIQRILGANKWMQKTVLASESVMLSFIAFWLAIIYIYIFEQSSVKGMFTADMSINSNLSLIFVACVLISIISFVFGIYPAHYISSFHVIDALKGKVNKSNRSSGLKNTLIIVQFTAAITLIIISMFIKLQHDYMADYSWGIQKENIAYIRINDYGYSNITTDSRTLGEELKKDSRIVDYTHSQFLPGNVNMSWNRNIKEKYVTIYSWPVMYNFLDFFGVTMLSGENFTKYGPDKGMSIVNKKFIDEYGFSETELIGEEIEYVGSNYEIIGIANDINFENLKMNIRPMLFATVKGYDHWMFVKISDKDVKGAIAHIENTWNKFSKEPFELKFLDERLNNLYKGENNLAKLISLFSLIAILIAIMGVYGLITFNSKYKSKEVAIRKVNGARVMDIILMLNRGMLVQLLIAFFITIPTVYYIINKWLDQFAYKTPTYWWIFVLGGFIVLLITAITVSIQSYRAATANPIEALKNE